jgi:hypothetical protein
MSTTTESIDTNTMVKTTTTPCEDGNTKLCPGQIRFESDKRQIGALLMITGFCALIQPMAGVATGIGNNGTTAREGVPLAQLIGGLQLITLGVLVIPTGYYQLVHGGGGGSRAINMKNWYGH